MKLYLLRHGVAGSRDPRRYPRDAERPLTPEGRARMRRAVLGMDRLGLAFDVIFTSPLKRARQTARIVASEIGASPAPVVLRPLAPDGTVQEVLGAIAGSAPAESVLMVGHEPGLSRLASQLLAPVTLDLSIELRKGGLCRIDVQGEPRAASGRLVLLITPKILRLLRADLD